MNNEDDCGYFRSSSYDPRQGIMFDCGHHFFKYVGKEFSNPGEAWEEYRKLHFEEIGTYPMIDGDVV